MSPKSTLRQNAKILEDAREYLTLVSQLTNIQKAIVNMPEESMTTPQKEYLMSLSPILKEAEPVVTEVMLVTEALGNLPSTAPKHKRRALGDNLSKLLMERAAHMHDLLATIFAAVDLFDAETTSEVKTGIAENV